jgi:glycine betaine/proline transport system ATP-binding protein
MIPVEIIAYENESPQVVLRRMKMNNLSSIFVLEKKDYFLGVLEMNKVVELVELHKHDLTDRAKNQFNHVNSETPLREVLPLFVNNTIPVAVVDQQKRLKGMITQSTLIASLTEQIGIEGNKKFDSYQLEVK